MKKLIFAASALVLSVSLVAAADDPIAVRQALMESNAASAGVAAAMLKGEMDYSPVVAKAAINALHATALAFGDYFPEGSETGGDTTASPKIWENMEGFQEAVTKFQTDSAAAAEASGKDGPADLEAFKAAITPVLGNCRGCHEDFRIQRN
ncbi:cytochrome c556 [Mesorhizobium sp. J18]|uniref:c-type cytochrome n=1 Tax=Mesorhizobium sp. J18 TaxID=935263 RepID=UPI001199F3F2|nr:cytochrome c [Mesorhizobium sp. J18]TWG93358.1 cytochrome c556 [Mesorhizobium sp. J18]